MFLVTPQVRVSGAIGSMNDRPRRTRHRLDATQVPCAPCFREPSEGARITSVRIVDQAEIPHYSGFAASLAPCTGHGGGWLGRELELRAEHVAHHPRKDHARAGAPAADHV